MTEEISTNAFGDLHISSIKEEAFNFWGSTADPAAQPGLMHRAARRCSREFADRRIRILAGGAHGRHVLAASNFGALRIL